MTHTLEFDSLELSFGAQRILSGIYMKCETGNVVGLLGRNGCGKSCLMKIVFGSMRSDYRFVRIDGRPLGTNYLRHRLISYLPQDSLIPNHISVRKAFDLFRIDMAEVLKDFPEIEILIDLKPPQLSGGYRRIVEAMLVLKSPSLFALLDEPFSGLMPLHIESLIALIEKEKTRKGIIITDHLHKHIRSVSDQLYVLSNGKTYVVKGEEQLVKYGYLKFQE
jgi:lipopolysaccharide export system ATP-binding protein